MDVTRWLADHGLGHHAEVFAENGVDVDVLRDLADADLKELGLNLGDRKRLLKAIAALDAEPVQDRVVPPLSAIRSAAERRQLTVMFVDLVGSTALAQRLDPEDMGAVIGSYQNAVACEITQFEGHVAKFMGDGVLAYFGWPMAHEDEAERAVRAGLAVAAAVGRLRDPTGDSLAARVGIATGLVVVGDMISDSAVEEGAVVGDTPNLAARLQALATPGEVVIAEATRALLGHRFDLIAQAPAALRGVAEPVVTYAVQGERPHESRFEAWSGPALPPMVGREHELALLLERWARARVGEGQVVILAGEAGIGKSRLIRALLEALEPEAHTRIRCQCSPFHTGSALWPVIQQLRHAAGIAQSDPGPAALDKLEALLARACDPSASAPLIADLLGLDGASRYGDLGLTAQARRGRTLAVLNDQLLGLAAKEPVLMIMEDVHWIDPTTRDLIEQSLSAIGSARILLLLISRPEGELRLTGAAAITRLTLNRLGQSAVEAMVARLGAGRELTPEWIEAIVAHTDGVPLFVEEMTKTVLETSAHSAVDRFDGPVIPATLQDALVARLDRLGPAREVAQIAAVIGREFSHALLAAVAGLPERELEAALGKLVASELIFRRATSSSSAYIFKHALIRDVAYESLLKSKRRDIHERVAAALEGDLQLAEAEPEVLAHHLAEAGFAARAIPYWQRAVRRALTRSAEIEAVEHLQRALRQVPRVAEKRAREQFEFELRAALGRALSTVRGFTAAETGQAFERAAELGRRLDVGARLFPVLWGLFIYHHAGGDLAGGDRSAHEFLTLAERHGEDGHLLTAERVVANSAAFFGRFEYSRCHAERVLTLYDPDRHRDLAIDYAYDQRVIARNILSLVLFALGHPAQAALQIREAVAEARALDHRASLAHALTIDCFHHHWRGDLAAVVEPAAEVDRLAREQAIPVWLALTTVLRGWAIGRHTPEEGIAMASHGMEMLDEIGVRIFGSYLLSVLADTKARAQQERQALFHLDEAIEAGRGNGDRWYEAELLRRKGELLAASAGESITFAEKSLRSAVEIAREQEARMWELRAATSLARLWGEHGERQKALDLLAPIYGWFSEGFDTADLKDAKVLLDELG